MKKAISLYCDESCHLKNNGDHVSMLGYIGVPHNTIKKHKKNLKQIRVKYKMYTEVKWTKVSNAKYDFHKALIDYFIDSDMIFTGLIIPTAHFGHAHMTDDEYYKMFFKLLSHKANINFEYNIYIDIKDTHSYKRVEELKTKLVNNDTFKIKNIQTIRSYESVFVQLADLILGAFTYDLNQHSGNNRKQFLIDALKVNFRDDTYEEYKLIDGTNTELILITLNKI